MSDINRAGARYEPRLGAGDGEDCSGTVALFGLAGVVGPEVRW
jgi:hypothetical protein